MEDCQTDKKLNLESDLVALRVYETEYFIM